LRTLEHLDRRDVGQVGQRARKRRLIDAVDIGRDAGAVACGGQAGRDAADRRLQDTNVTDLARVTPALSRAFESRAVIEIGTSRSRSERRCAVTMMSSSLTDTASAASCAGSAASCASAGAAPMANGMATARLRANRRLSNRADMLPLSIFPA
jgi:hypothetical protein